MSGANAALVGPVSSATLVYVPQRSLRWPFRRCSLCCWTRCCRWWTQVWTAFHNAFSRSGFTCGCLEIDVGWTSR